MTCTTLKSVFPHLDASDCHIIQMTKKNLVIFLQKLINSSNHDKKTKHNNEKAICTEKPIWNNMWCIFSPYTQNHQLHTTHSFISISTNSIDPNKKKYKIEKQTNEKNLFFRRQKKTFCASFCIYWNFMLLTFIIESHLNAQHSDSTSSWYFSYHVLLLFTLYGR